MKWVASMRVSDAGTCNVVQEAHTAILRVSESGGCSPTHVGRYLHASERAPPIPARSLDTGASIAFNDRCRPYNVDARAPLWAQLPFIDQQQRG